MFLFHNVLLLRYVEYPSRVGRALNIIKMRNSRHDERLYEFGIHEHGLTIGAPVEASSGTLGWTALTCAGSHDIPLITRSASSRPDTRHRRSVRPARRSRARSPDAGSRRRTRWTAASCTTQCAACNA